MLSQKSEGREFTKRAYKKHLLFHRKHLTIRVGTVEKSLKSKYTIN